MKNNTQICTLKAWQNLTKQIHGWAVWVGRLSEEKQETGVSVQVSVTDVIRISWVLTPALEMDSYSLVQ